MTHDPYENYPQNRPVPHPGSMTTPPAPAASNADLQAWRLRLCARLDALWLRFPGYADEAVHERWCEAHNVFYRRYCYVEDMLIEQGVELAPIPQPTTHAPAPTNAMEGD